MEKKSCQLIKNNDKFKCSISRFYTSAQFALVCSCAVRPLIRAFVHGWGLIRAIGTVCNSNSTLEALQKTGSITFNSRRRTTIPMEVWQIIFIALLVPVPVGETIYLFYFNSMAVASDIVRWFRTKTMRTQLLLSFGLLVSLVVGVFIGIWAGSVFLLRDTLIQKSKKFLVEQISLIASRFTSEVWSALARRPQRRGPSSLTRPQLFLTVQLTY